MLLAASCVTPLATPVEFYETLLREAAQSRSRVTLASLYLGTGDQETALVEALRRQLSSHPELHVAVQLDYNRALRGARPAGADPPPEGAPPACSADALLPLFAPLLGTRSEKSSCCPGGDLFRRVRVGLTLLPQHRNAFGARFPPRLAEALGVFHAKAYVFDDRAVLLSGANLSGDYFSNRQDRYVLIRAPGQGCGNAGGAAAAAASGDGGALISDGRAGVAALAAYLHGTIGRLSRLPGSHLLAPDGRVLMVGVKPPPALPQLAGTAVYVRRPPLPADPALLRGPFCAGLRSLLQGASEGTEASPSPPAGQAALQPRWQLGVLGVRCEQAAQARLLASLPQEAAAAGAPSPPAADLSIATGYFNPTVPLQRSLIRARGTGVSLLTAAPTANGFLGAAGTAGSIPFAYALLLEDFLQWCKREGRLVTGPQGETGATAGAGSAPAAPPAPGISVTEYGQPGWTFHAKGLWLLRQHQGEGGKLGQREGVGVVSLIGSPNFGARSADVDLELQCELRSADPGLVRRLVRERDALWGAQGAHRAIASATPVPFPGREVKPALRAFWGFVQVARRGFAWFL